MNAMPKIVVSRTPSQPSWQNTTVLDGDLAAEVRALKEASGDDIAIPGSGSIVAQRPMTLLSTRRFANGKVVMSYALAR